MWNVRVEIALAQALIPWYFMLMLPKQIFGAVVEDNVDSILGVVIGAIAIFMIGTSLVLMRKLGTDEKMNVTTRLLHIFIGFVISTALHWIAIVLYGAPINVLVQRTILFAVLLTSVTTVPVVAHIGVRWNELRAIIWNGRANDDCETFLLYASAGAHIGAHIGVFPIPLDWDRPWQQWPLTCVYGALAGHSMGIVLGLFVIVCTRHKTPPLKKD